VRGRAAKEIAARELGRLASPDRSVMLERGDVNGTAIRALFAGAPSAACRTRATVGSRATSDDPIVSFARQLGQTLDEKC
jgi:hypothetical protein